MTAQGEKQNEQTAGNPASSTGATDRKPEAQNRDPEKDRAADVAGNEAGDALRGGRLPDPEADTNKGPRPADDSAHSAIPSRSFDL